MKDKLLFVDAETDGLYGPFLTAAVIVTDLEGRETERLYLGIQRNKMKVVNPWVRENVLPRLGNYQPVDSQEELLDSVWQLWNRYRESSYVIGDVIFPVECRLFEECVRLKPLERSMQGPFPMLDLSSILYAKGIDPLAERASLCAEHSDNQHNALYDVELSVEIYRRYMGAGI